MQAHQRWFAARRTDQQCDMLLSIVGRAKSCDLRVGHAVERKLRPSHEFDFWAAIFARDLLGGYSDRRIFGIDYPQRREKARRTRSEERRVGKECRSQWWPYH